MPMPDLDTVLGYYTVKYAHIRDCRLGIIQKMLMLLILVKIGALTIVYRCNHLLEVPVTGSARATAQQPTMHSCDPKDPECLSDFTPLNQLPYCNHFNPDKLKPQTKPTSAEAKAPKSGAEGKAKESRRLGEKTVVKKESPPTSPSPGAIPQRDCVLWDAPAMTRGRSPVPGTLFMPTSVTETEQKRGCKPTEANGYTCDTKPWVRSDPKAKSTTYHVADVERFTLRINQAFSSAVDGVSGTSTDFEGFAEGRPDLQDFYTSRKGYVSRLEKKDAEQLEHIAALHPIPSKADFTGDFKNMFHDGNGDIFEVNDILRMADLRGGSMLDILRDDGTTMRQKGAVVTIDVTYSNKKNFDIFGNTPETYVMSAKYLPMTYYKIQYETIHDADTRTMSDVHGLLIMINVTGSIRTFDLTNLLTVLTTAMVSLALASTLTDMILSYAPCLGLKDHYNILKYQPTMDFSDLQARINTLKEQAKAQGKDYDPAVHKSSVSSDAINEYATAKKHIDQDTMLKIICTFEMRLNRLDGMDACDGGDACSEVVKNWRTTFLESDAFVGAAPRNSRDLS